VNLDLQNRPTPAAAAGVGDGATLGRLARLAPWLAVGALTLALTALTASQAVARYRALRSGWSWDLAYYNQWFWVFSHGGDTISVNPISSYAEEGPWLWRNNYLAPVRVLLAPFYRIAPGPPALLMIQSVLFWWLVPATFTLVRSESGSPAAALGASALVPLTPLLWPLAWNDFRELQIAMPFVLWGLQGVRSRSLPVSLLGIGGMLACRQEFAIIVATFALLPPRDKEDVGRTYRWANALVVLGLGWFLLGFFGYLKLVIGNYAPMNYIAQFTGPKASVAQTLTTAWQIVSIGLGVWTIFLLFAPRVAALMVPWLWSLSSGRWSLRSLPTEDWHHVRYAAPVVALGLAAGLVGYARLARWSQGCRKRQLMLAGVWLTAAAGSAALLGSFLGFAENRLYPIDAEEARAIWAWIDRVGPDDGVLAAYEVSAPLSSRRLLRSYILSVNTPRGYPNLDPEFRWVFYRNSDPPQPFEQQGFRVVHRGPFLTIYRRGVDGSAGSGE
jgi:hypothetical protein